MNRGNTKKLLVGVARSLPNLHFLGAFVFNNLQVPSTFVAKPHLVINVLGIDSKGDIIV